MIERLPLLLLAFLAGLMVFYGVKKLVEASAMSSWPTATATILAAEVGKSSGGGTYFWVVDLVFRYTVGPTTYTSTRYSALGQPGFYLRRTAEAIVARHRPGTHALVAYPPGDPAAGTLAPGMRPVMVPMLRIIAGGLVAFAIVWHLYRGGAAW